MKPTMRGKVKASPISASAIPMNAMRAAPLPNVPQIARRQLNPPLLQRH
jgi:hypothetical protein